MRCRRLLLLCVIRTSTFFCDLQEPYFKAPMPKALSQHLRFVFDMSGQNHQRKALFYLYFHTDLQSAASPLRHEASAGSLAEDLDCHKTRVNDGSGTATDM